MGKTVIRREGEEGEMICWEKREYAQRRPYSVHAPAEEESVPRCVVLRSRQVDVATSTGLYWKQNKTRHEQCMQIVRVRGHGSLTYFGSFLNKRLRPREHELQKR